MPLKSQKKDDKMVTESRNHELSCDLQFDRDSVNTRSAKCEEKELLFKSFPNA